MNDYQQFKYAMPQWTPETLQAVSTLTAGILKGWPIHFFSDDLIQEMRRRAKNAKRRKPLREKGVIDLTPQEYHIQE